MSPEAEKFIETVQKFCKWAEGDVHELVDARQFLISLMSYIPHLEEYSKALWERDDYRERTHEEHLEDFTRFFDLPFSYYRAVFDPVDPDFLSKELPVMPSLQDDFADIYRELFDGLQAYEQGNVVDALSMWIWGYVYHWGRHASSALYAIDTFYCKSLDEKNLQSP